MVYNLVLAIALACLILLGNEGNFLVVLVEHIEVLYLRDQALCPGNFGILIRSRRVIALLSDFEGRGLRFARGPAEAVLLPLGEKCGHFLPEAE